MSGVEITWLFVSSRDSAVANVRMAFRQLVGGHETPAAENDRFRCNVERVMHDRDIRGERVASCRFDLR